VRYGEAGLCARTRRKFANRAAALETKVRILEIFHSQPSTYGINRASWTGESLAKALHRKYRVTISASTASGYLRESGYTMRRARQVLTSSDPNYRAKVEVVRQTLQSLGDTETLFFIDELGPLAVKKHGGRSFVKKGKALEGRPLDHAGAATQPLSVSQCNRVRVWCDEEDRDSPFRLPERA
jgi:transposase